MQIVVFVVIMGFNGARTKSNNIYIYIFNTASNLSFVGKLFRSTRGNWWGCLRSEKSCDCVSVIFQKDAATPPNDGPLTASANLSCEQSICSCRSPLDYLFVSLEPKCLHLHVQTQLFNLRISYDCMAGLSCVYPCSLTLTALKCWDLMFCTRVWWSMCPSIWIYLLICLLFFFPHLRVWSFFVRDHYGSHSSWNH